jgi:hypothetical protein
MGRVNVLTLVAATAATGAGVLLLLVADRADVGWYGAVILAGGLVLFGMAALDRWRPPPPEPAPPPGKWYPVALFVILAVVLVMIRIMGRR